MRKFALAVIASAVVAASGTARAQKYNLTVAGYSPGGLVSTIGTGMDAALNAAYPGSTVTYQTGSGGLANAMPLEQNKVPLGFVADTELAVAIKGKPRSTSRCGPADALPAIRARLALPGHARALQQGMGREERHRRLPISPPRNRR